MPGLHIQVWLPGTERKKVTQYLIYDEVRKPAKIAGMKFEFKNLEIHFHKRHVSFLAVKTAKFKRGISLYNM